MQQVIWIVYKIRILGQFGIENYSWKVAIMQTIFVNIAHFPCTILGSLFPLFREQNVHNVSIVLISNIYDGNIEEFRQIKLFIKTYYSSNLWSMLLIFLVSDIRTFWHRKLCMKNWYNSKSLWLLSIFLTFCFVSYP